MILNFLHRWIEHRRRIPKFVRWYYPDAHFCEEMDMLLIIENSCDCFCGHVKHEEIECPSCGHSSERRFICNTTDLCFWCCIHCEEKGF